MKKNILMKIYQPLVSLINRSIDKYRFLLSKYIFNESINNELVLSLFEKGINSTR